MPARWRKRMSEWAFTEMLDCVEAIVESRDCRDRKGERQATRAYRVYNLLFVLADGKPTWHRLKPLPRIFPTLE